jgi:hypothetical protein
MHQRPYRGLREVNVWQRGIDYVRSAYRANSADRSKRGFKSQRRGAGKSAATGVVARQANLSVLGAVSPQCAKPVQAKPELKTVWPAQPGDAAPIKGQPCGPSSEVHLSIASRMTMGARNQRSRGLRFAGRASLGPATRRDLRAWQRGGDFAQAAKAPVGGWRGVWQKLFGRTKERGLPSLPRAVAGQGPEAMRIYLRNAARRRTQRSVVQPPPARSQGAAWEKVRDHLHAAAAPQARGKSFRDARWRQLSLGLLARVLGRSPDKSAQPPYRPAGSWQPPSKDQNTQ